MTVFRVSALELGFRALRVTITTSLYACVLLPSPCKCKPSRTHGGCRRVIRVR